MTTFVDPRVRMREALRDVVQADPEQWHEPSLAIFRNRLLDVTGSDARPLADLLLEAWQRGWRDAIPRERTATQRWDAITAPFVMRWSTERFVQHEMAQWAAESWGFALGTIAADQLRIALPPPLAAPRGRPKATAGVSFTRTVSPSPSGNPSGSPSLRQVATPPTARAPGGRSASASLFPQARLSQARLSQARLSPTRLSPTRLSQVRVGRTKPYVPMSRSNSSIPMLDPRVVWGLAAAAALSYVFFIARITMAVNQDRRGTARAARVADSVIKMNGRPDTITASRTVAAIAVAAPPAPRDSVRIPAAQQPVGDPSRMLYVDPARRASGASIPVPTAAAPPSLAYDAVVMDDGTEMRGRIEIVRAGSVIFRDMRTGIRHELRKEEIDRIITEYGSTMRFRTATEAPGAKSASDARRRVATGVRARGLAGAYIVRYAAATAVGSPECASVWSRPPDAVDRAVVVHVPGADTLNVAFDGGNNFPGNVDPEGYFASTFRIVPDQARTSTALTTRLTGQFREKGALDLQVSIVFFRRMRQGQDLSCAVNITATGTRVSDAR